MTARISRPTYRVRFARVGRDHNVADLVAEARDADELATRVWRYVKARLASREVEVDIDLDAGTGTITVGGFRPAGEFTVRREEATPDAPPLRAA